MKQRIISAIVLLTIFIPILLIGNAPFAILMTIISWMGLYEIINARSKKKEFPFLMKILAYILVSFFVITNYKVNESVFNDNLLFYLDYRLIAILIFAYIAPIIFIDDSKKYSFNDALFLIGATMFIGISFNLLISIRNFNLEYIIYIFLIATITDTFALLTGRKIGKNKLAPSISPNKTIEGSIGGSIMGTFIATVYYLEFIDPTANIFAITVMTLILSVVGQIGDLVFSAIKRYYNTKDFSNLIPGHGGILDRLDSIIFIVLAFLLFLSVL